MRSRDDQAQRIDLVVEQRLECLSDPLLLGDVRFGGHIVRLVEMNDAHAHEIKPRASHRPNHLSFRSPTIG